MLKSLFSAVNAIVSFGSFGKPDQNHPSARLCWYVPSDLDQNNSFKLSNKILRSGAVGLPGAEPQPADLAKREPLRRSAQPRLPRARLQQDRQDRRGRLQGAGK